MLWSVAIVYSFANDFLLGTGKGTQCAALSVSHNFIHMSTGDMCREAIENQTELGRKVEPYIKSGKLVPDKLMTEVINKRLEQKDANERGVLLDGYPRTTKQAAELIKNDNIIVDRVILIQTSDEICIQRVLGNFWIDLICFNLINIK